MFSWGDTAEPTVLTSSDQQELTTADASKPSKSVTIAADPAKVSVDLMQAPALPPDKEFQNAKREKKLDALAAITNSKAFREDLQSVSSDNETVSALTALMEDDAAIRISDLTKVKRLGEGGFAYVDLYQRTVGDVVIKYAVKEMKDKCVNQRSNSRVRSMHSSAIHPLLADVTACLLPLPRRAGCCSRRWNHTVTLASCRCPKPSG